MVIASALDRVDMDNNGLFNHFCAVHGIAEMTDIVAVNGADIFESQILKERAGIDNILESVFQSEKMI